MRLSGKYLNDLLEADRQPRSLDDDEFYMLTSDGLILPYSTYKETYILNPDGKLVPPSKQNKTPEK